MDLRSLGVVVNVGSELVLSSTRNLGDEQVEPSPSSAWRPDHLEQLATGHARLGLQGGFPRECCVQATKTLDPKNAVVVEAWSELRGVIMARADGEPIWGEYRITDGLPAYRYHRDHHEWGKRKAG